MIDVSSTSTKEERATFPFEAVSRVAGVGGRLWGLPLRALEAVDGAHGSRAACTWPPWMSSVGTAYAGATKESWS